MVFISLALSAELVLGAGYARVVNDPFGIASGARASVAVRPIEWLNVEVAGGIYPSLTGEFGGWNALGQELLTVYEVVPDVAPIRHTAALSVGFLPVQATVGSFSTRVGLHGALALVHTMDDLEAIRAEGEPSYEATRDQVHAGGVLGLSAEIRSGPIGARLRLERMTYTETIGSEVKEAKDPIWVGIDLAWYIRLGHR